MSELVTLVPIRLDVDSTSGDWPVTVSVSATPASCRVRLRVISCPTVIVTPCLTVGWNP